MSEIKEYDQAVKKFHDTLDLNSLPIMSWDMYAPHFTAVCKNYQDIVALDLLAKTNQWSYQKDFGDNLLHKHHVIVVTDPQLRIVHATKNIADMNGYSPKEIVGKTPKMFQGAETCTETTQSIRSAVQNNNPFEAVIINYRKDGSSYKCWIKGEPVFNTSGEVVNFIAYEKEVA